MSGSTRRRLKSEISRGHNVDDADDGTAARTRPLSYDEIMLKRKSRKEVVGVKDEVGEMKSTRFEGTVANPGHHSKDAYSNVMKNSRDYLLEDTYRNKAEKKSRMDDAQCESRNKESRALDSRSKHRNEKDLRIATDTLKNDSRGYRSSKPDEYSRDDTRHDNEKRRHRDSVVQDRYMERSGGALEREHKRKDLSVEDEKYRARNAVKKHDTGNRREERKGKDQSVGDEKYKARDPVKKHDTGNRREEHKGEDLRVEDEKYRTRDPVKKLDTGNRWEEHNRKDLSVEDEKYRARDRVKKLDTVNRREAYQRKDLSVEDEKYRARDPVKKHDTGNRRDSANSERKDKMDLPHSRIDETKPKRRRSRSQEHVKEKGRRSPSPSPKKHKSDSPHDYDYGQVSLRSQKDKSSHHSSNGSASHHRRHGGSSSGLGGYSPRKRKTEAAVKTPSPIHSPEKKNVGWDLPPSVADGNLGGSISSAPQLLSQTKPSNMSELAAGFTVSSSAGMPLSAILSSNLSAFNLTSIDSIELTQATRPMRRLYIDNIPGIASEKDVMNCFNEFLLSSGANHIRGKPPCISCMIHKEKGQALVEFLTPEDASAALSFDGRSLFGSIVKIRRPKDFVGVPPMPVLINNINRKNQNTHTPSPTPALQSGLSERSKLGDSAISNIVRDSPHKIFIGGIAEGFSSEMIMDIVSAFGPLKAYHLEINKDLNERCAFIEYVDQSVTLKACAGLNGMKLGGRVLTAAQAFQNSSSMEKLEDLPFYGIPEHVKPLLEMPTPVLMLKNVLDQHVIKVLSDTELDDVMEDIRLECSRFGSIVSINLVKDSGMLASSLETKEDADMKPLRPLEEIDSQEYPVNGGSVGGGVDLGHSEVEFPSNVEESGDGDDGKEGENRDLVPIMATTNIEVEAAGRSTIDAYETDKIVPHSCDDEAADHPQTSAVASGENVGKSVGSDMDLKEIPVQLSEGSELHPDKLEGDETTSIEDALELDKTSDKSQDVFGPAANYSVISNQVASENGVKDENACDDGNMFEVGSVLVEFKRAEASCMAAHCLHGRVFDDHIVTVQYVPLDAYRARFP